MSDTIQIAPINTRSVGEYDKRATSFSERVASIRISDQSSLERADAICKEIKDAEKEIESTRKTIVDPLNQAKEAVQLLFKPVQSRLEGLRRGVDTLIINYTTEQERLEREERARLQRIADAEEEKKRKALEARAIRAEDRGDDEKAEELRQQKQEVFVPAPQVAKKFSNPAGLSLVDDWSAEVVDLMALVKAIAAGREPITLIEANMKVLNQMATAIKASKVIPGVKIVCKKVPRRR